MSTESKPLKLSKKLKFKFDTKSPSNKKPGQNRENGTRNSKSSPRDDHEVRGGRGKEEVNRKGNFKTDGDKQWNAKSSVRGKQFIGSRNEVKGRGNFKPVSSDSKRKRTYADQEYKSDETHGRTHSRKPLSNNGRDHLKNGFAKGKNSNNSERTIWGSTKVKDACTKTRSPYPKHAEIHDGKRRTNAGEVKLVSSKVQNKSESTKYLDLRQNKHLHAYPSPRSANKIVLDKSGMNSEATDGRPKKKRKRGIRLDPHDMSNKRLDDSIESPKEKKDNLEKNVEMSKNAQFRAIQPSPSILAYVEENLLGRRRLIELRRAGYNINLNAPLDNVPSSDDSERMRIEENIFRNKMTFFAAAKVSSSFPPPDFPEVAFAGRSNVGKSSLLNSLTRQWGVARTSDKPGLTQTINFFELGSKLGLVDLPGYGFAYAKEEVKDAWEDLVKEYVSTRVGLKQVCLLVDTKWGLKPRDHELIELMERSETKYQIVLTKTDLVFPMDVARRAMQIEESLKAKKSIVQPLMMVSSKTGAGIRSLRTVLGKISQFARLKV